MKVQLVRSSPLLANVSSTLNDDQQFISLGHTIGATNRSTSLGGSIVTQTKPLARGSVGYSDNDNYSDGAMIDEGEEATRYLQAIELIVRKSETLSADNEKLVQRYGS